MHVLRDVACARRWQRDLDAKNRCIFKRIAGPLLIELGYAKDPDW